MKCDKLKAHRIVGMDEQCFRVDNDYYLKSEANKVIEELEESHKMEVEQLLMEIVELKKACNEKFKPNLTLQQKD